jgi:hypothetical protein
MSHFPYIVALCTILFSCTKPHNAEISVYKGFELEEELRSNVVNLDTVFCRYPFRVTVKDSVVIVFDLHNADFFFHAFSYPEWKYLVSFGKRGQAPKEMLSAETFQFNSLDSIWTLDANKMELRRWSMNPQECTVLQEETILLDKELVRPLDFYAMDSGFLIPDYLGASRYHCVNEEGVLVASEEAIPTEKKYEGLSRPALAQAWRSFINYSAKHQILVMATQLGEVLEISNLKENERTILKGPNGEPKFQISGGEAIPTGIMGFSDVQITDNYIYAVFHGTTFKDIMSSYQKGVKPKDGGRYIYVFDLKGKPVKKYILDRYIYGIDVNEETGTIIATDVNSDNPIVEFKINM